VHAASERSLRYPMLRHATGDTGLLSDGRLLLCDRDPKWSSAVESWLGTAGVCVVRTPPRAPNCTACAERFVRSVKVKCLNRVIPLGERHLRRTVREFATHDHRERNHQGLANELIERPAAQRATGTIRRRPASWWDSQLLLRESPSKAKREARRPKDGPRRRPQIERAQ
jgi:hypothetical protein